MEQKMKSEKITETNLKRNRARKHQKRLRLKNNVPGYCAVVAPERYLWSVFFEQRVGARGGGAKVVRRAAATRKRSNNFRYINIPAANYFSRFAAFTNVSYMCLCTTDVGDNRTTHCDAITDVRSKMFTMSKLQHGLLYTVV